MSASNPSRIPFEMMAAGLPVVELYRENNLYDLPEGGCLLAESSPAAVATALIKIIEDDNLRKEMSQSGHSFMQKYPLEKGYNQFIKFIDNCFSNQAPSTKATRPPKIYTLEPVRSTSKIQKITDSIKIPVEFEWDAPGSSAPAIKHSSLPRRVVRKTIKLIRGNHE